MIPNDVKVGSEFYTRISASSTTKVRIVEDTREGTKRYRVQRCDTGAILRKLRGPGELHVTPGPWHRHATPVREKVVGTIAPKGLVKTMGGKSQAELLAKLAELPDDTRKFLTELIQAITPSAPVEGKQARR